MFDWTWLGIPRNAYKDDNKAYNRILWQQQS